MDSANVSNTTTTTVTTLLEHYNWLGALLSLVFIVILVKSIKFLAFKVPALAKAREFNQAQDKKKWHKDKYPPIVRASRKVGLYSNLFLFLVILPLCVTLDPQPLWKIVLDVFIILMFYDFFYYLTHRFLFHGQGRLRRVHAVHHQARSPTWLDAHYVHPVETFIGLALYMASIALLAPLLGPYHVATIVLTVTLYTQLNILNHCFIDLPYFPFRLLSWITVKHAKHHENMHRGNYASLNLLYDWLFGTFEAGPRATGD
jgi:sterol desaturase/sphingolipid hydroxylase (fatty acid hydroxylase superfamily)